MILENSWRQAFGDNPKVCSPKELEDIRLVILALTADCSQAVFDEDEVNDFIQGLIKNGKLRIETKWNFNQMSTNKRRLLRGIRKTTNYIIRYIIHS